MVRAMVMETANKLSSMYGSEEGHVYIANAVSWATIAEFRVPRNGVEGLSLETYVQQQRKLREMVNFNS